MEGKLCLKNYLVERKKHMNLTTIDGHKTFVIKTFVCKKGK